MAIYKYQVGDKVKVIKKAYEQGSWEPGMDELVGDGNIYTIRNCWGPSAQLNVGWTIRTSALELVEKAIN